MLKNTYFAGKELATQYGTIKFDAKGENDELKADEQKALAKLRGFEYIEPKKEAAATKEPEKKEAPKRTNTRKRTTTAKKTEDK